MQAAKQVQDEERELVTFRAGDQDFCLDISFVREIRGWTPATVLPHAPDFVLGVINLRGAIVPIVDLANRLGLGATRPDDRHVIVITVVGQQTVGFLVDSVADIIGVAPVAIQPTPDVASQSSVLFIKGVIARDDRMLRLIDISTILPQGSEDAA
jgi:purine-binding chemotaxis protein CheW